MTIIHSLVEGDIDEAVAHRLIQEVGQEVGTTYGKQGIGYIAQKIAGFNQSAVDMTYLALADFVDTGLACPGLVVATYLPNRSPRMLFRVVEPEIESWLLADKHGIANFLRVPVHRLEIDLNGLPDPKQFLVNLARRSNSSQVRAALVPSEGSTAIVGKSYNLELVRFVLESWDVAAARANSGSLDRCVRRLEEVVRD